MTSEALKHENNKIKRKFGKYHNTFISYNENIQIFTREHTDFFITLAEKLWCSSQESKNTLFITFLAVIYRDLSVNFKL